MTADAFIANATAILAALAEVQRFERADPYQRDVMRAGWQGIVLTPDAEAYIDAICICAGPRRWRREEALYAAYHAGRPIVTLADVIPLVYASAQENPPDRCNGADGYRRTLMIVPEGVTA